ncbi:hypothetical protein DV965_15205, partial [Staphylococcus pseudintermedius]|uniref:hypothetical protein n=1 Tax=Staphylococcus pseudintermedius TaxID=283734 RepID=UPI000E39CE11
MKDDALKTDEKRMKKTDKHVELALESIDGKTTKATKDESTRIADAKIKNYEKALPHLDNKSVKTVILLKYRLFVPKFNKIKDEINKLAGKTDNTELVVKD